MEIQELESSRMALREIIFKPCAFNPNGMNGLNCRDMSKLPVKNPGCCSIKCTSPERSCKACVEVGPNPAKVVDPVSGLCQFHTEYGEKAGPCPPKEDPFRRHAWSGSFDKRTPAITHSETHPPSTPPPPPPPPVPPPLPPTPPVPKPDDVHEPPVSDFKQMSEFDWHTAGPFERLDAISKAVSGSKVSKKELGIRWNTSVLSITEHANLERIKPRVRKILEDRSPSIQILKVISKLPPENQLELAKMVETPQQL
jgi:hypothetical protein